MQVAVLGVFRILFDLLSVKLPKRCDQLAQDCVRLSRRISFAKIEIHGLVDGIILPKRRRPEHVSNY